MTNTASSRPRSSRRESVGGAAASGSTRVRKNSVANNAVGGSGGIGAGAARPRANTISHVDMKQLGFMDGLSMSSSRLNALGAGHGHHMSLNGLPGSSGFGYRGMSTATGNHGSIPQLPKLETHGLSMDTDIGMRTAPPFHSMGGIDLEQLFSHGNTINPQQLHFADGMGIADTAYSGIPAMQSPQVFSPQYPNFSFPPWDTHMQFNDPVEHAIDESSPSQFDSGASQNGFGETLLEGICSFASSQQPMWNMQDGTMQPILNSGPFTLDTLGQGLPNLDSPVQGAMNKNPPPGTVSPQSLHDPTPTQPPYFEQAMTGANQLETAPNMQGACFTPSLTNFSSDSPSIASSSMAGSARQSSVTSLSTESITDVTRQALMTSLAQPSAFGQTNKKFSQPSLNSPLPLGTPYRSAPVLPSTSDLQRYVNAYIQYFHPHLPFLHIASLSFDSPDYVGNLRSTSGHASFGHSGIVGGGGCLILAMAAIGALYEYDHPASKDLFDAAKKMIGLYIDERRRANLPVAAHGPNHAGDSSAQSTPLWLVQAMLLNLIYGHQCGDKAAADSASHHCAALVKLVRAAKIGLPPQQSTNAHHDATNGEDTKAQNHDDADVQMDNAGTPAIESATDESANHFDEHAAWYTWKVTEERKRTLFAVFILSSLLVTAYNHNPTIMNSEIQLDLPCEEELWAAESAQDWLAKGGATSAEHDSLSFASALSSLLTANQRQQGSYPFAAAANQDLEDAGEHDIRPSTFGCLVLINALHNYIWETRSRHHGRQWTAQETESMFSHIEPALNAWQAAWKANDRHTLERPNSFGIGPLSADSIPLLDLAFVRLFVDLGRSKEAFWQRDFDAMANELARGEEIVQLIEDPPSSTSLLDSSGSTNGSLSKTRANGSIERPARSSSQAQHSGQSSKRERHLRKAAFYAADSLSIACRLNLTYADPTSHELPIQSAMCFFDCGQVLAEWVSTLQERVGRYLGILGKDGIDYTQVPAIMLLEGEDIELLRKIEQICGSMETKMVQQANTLAMELAGLDPAGALNVMAHPMQSLPGLNACGHGSKILRITAYMLEKAAVWPVTHVMARALETQASHMNTRAEASVSAPQ
ncbi:hypothetical protein LTR66_013869 [Elasticomyces elasticus]|nr:hypothetical protein LTR66_013869 [Elasticomyces elasticus]